MPHRYNAPYSSWLLLHVTTSAKTPKLIRFCADLTFHRNRNIFTVHFYPPLYAFTLYLQIRYMRLLKVLINAHKQRRFFFPSFETFIPICRIHILRLRY